MVSDGGVSTVGPDHEIKINFNLNRATAARRNLVTDFEPCFTSSEVSSSELMIKQQLNVGHGVQDVQETLVQLGAIDRVD